MGQVGDGLLQGRCLGRQRVLRVGVGGAARDRLLIGKVRVRGGPLSLCRRRVDRHRGAAGAQWDHVGIRGVFLRHEVGEGHDRVGRAAGADDLIEPAAERAARRRGGGRADRRDRRRAVAADRRHRDELQVVRQDVAEEHVGHRLPRGDGDADGVAVGEVRAGRRLALGRSRRLLDPEELWLHRIGALAAEVGDVDRRVAGAVDLILEAAGSRHVVGVIRLGKRADRAGEVDHRCGLVGAVATKRELHHDQLIARLAVDDHRRTVGILGEGVGRLAGCVEGQHRRGERQAVVARAARLEADAVVGRWGRVACGRHHDVDEGRVADVGAGVVERDRERNVLTDQARQHRAGDRGGRRGGQGIPPLKHVDAQPFTDPTEGLSWKPSADTRHTATAPLSGPATRCRH